MRLAAKYDFLPADFYGFRPAQLCGLWPADWSVDALEFALPLTSLRTLSGWAPLWLALSVTALGFLNGHRAHAAVQVRVPIAVARTAGGGPRVT